METRRQDDTGDGRRGRLRVSRGSHSRRGTGRGRSGRGRWRRRRRRQRRWFYARFTSPDTTTTCTRDGGRDDTAPYWTALRKYNGAPLLRYVHPNLDVGVGATPLTPLAISAVCVPPSSGLVRRSPLLPILLSSALRCPRPSSATAAL